MTDSPQPFTVVEASIADLRGALESGSITSVELVARYLNRIAFYDRHGILLNSVPVLNPAVFDEAAASDARRASGKILGPLDGIPYTAKDSYKVTGLTVASGSPAFARLRATDDAFTIAQLRAAGAVFVGRTNMPPMANGGMQRGVYGRAESPYNADFLTSAFGSGSSNGSGTATGASFAAFGLGEETWSSGRAPASNNALVAYTPSRGVISTRGNWPLVPTMDVVVPHTRSVDDLFELLNIIVDDDPDVRGDLWRAQRWIELPAASLVRPDDYARLRDPDALRGKRVGVPRMYINADPEATSPIETRDSVIELWQALRRDLESLGAEVVEVDFPVVSNYEKDRPGTQTMVERGLVPQDFADREIWDLSIFSWDDFLRANGDPDLHALADVDGPLIFPHPSGALPDRYGHFDLDITEYVTRAAQGVTPFDRIPLIEEGMRGLEATRKVDLEDWMDSSGLAAVVFPTVADVGPADTDVNESSADLAWRNGTWVANGNLVPRHLGIPTVTVPMGTMSDIGMPVGLTIAGKAYDDSALLSYGWAIESMRARRTAPPRTPALVGDGGLHAVVRTTPVTESVVATPPSLTLSATVLPTSVGLITVVFSGTTDASELAVFVNGESVAVELIEGYFGAEKVLPASAFQMLHSEWREPYGAVVVALARSADGATSGAYRAVGGA